jgi:hypothetical protein
MLTRRADRLVIRLKQEKLNFTLHIIALAAITTIILHGKYRKEAGTYPQTDKPERWQALLSQLFTFASRPIPVW